MRILFLLTYYYPHWTGLTQYAKALGEALAKRGWRVTVLTTQHIEDLPKTQIVEGVNVIRESGVAKLSRSIISIGLWIKMIQQIWQADRVVVFLPFGEAIYAAGISRLMRKPVFLIYNGDLVLPSGRFNQFLERLFDWTTRMAVNWSDGVIVNTIDYARSSRVLAKYPDKWIELVPPLKARTAGAREIKEINRLINRPRSMVVGFAGRFVEEKGFDVLLKSIPLVEKEIKNVIFLFAGETKIEYENFFEKCEELVKDAGKNVVWLGRLEREMMWAFYKNCDVLTISSRSDFFPFVQAEAMLSGVPVVVTDIPGARWLVKTTGMGRVVAPNNPELLAKGIEEVIKNKNKYARNKLKLQKIFDYERLINDYEKLLKLRV